MDFVWVPIVSIVALHYHYFMRSNTHYIYWLFHSCFKLVISLYKKPIKQCMHVYMGLKSPVYTVTTAHYKPPLLSCLHFSPHKLANSYHKHATFTMVCLYQLTLDRFEKLKTNHVTVLSSRQYQV